MSITTKTGALPVKLKFQAEEDPADKLPKRYRMHNDSFHVQLEVVHDRKVVYEPVSGSGLYGEVFEIKNKSKKDKSLAPANFFKKGVRAIKLDSDILKKNETTKMYIISIRG